MDIVVHGKQVLEPVKLQTWRGLFNFTVRQEPLW